jgi:hypothetical protein
LNSDGIETAGASICYYVITLICILCSGLNTVDVVQRQGQLPPSHNFDRRLKRSDRVRSADLYGFRSVRGIILWPSVRGRNIPNHINLKNHQNLVSFYFNQFYKELPSSFSFILHILDNNPFTYSAERSHKILLTSQF